METDNPDLDVDQYRRDYESDDEWDMRRSFILAHCDKRSLERLICLANCYINMEVYGCSYPSAVMQEVRELADQIPNSDAESSHESRKRAKYENLQPFVKQTEASKCESAIVTVAAAAAVTTMNEKQRDETNQAVSICFLDFERCLCSGIFSEDFLIFQSSAAASAGIDYPVSTLCQSLQMNHLQASWQFAAEDGHSTCTLSVAGASLATGSGGSKSSLKIAVAKAILDRLKERFWTVVRKEGSDLSQPAIGKDDLLGPLGVSSAGSSSKQQTEQHPADSSFGIKLLQKLGWQGGGLGKEGKGIEQPVQLVAVIKREGLGFEGAGSGSAGFRKAVDKILAEYAQSNEEKDLSFSSEFSSEERNVIHQVALRLGLKSVSRGKGAERCLTVSRKRSPHQLLDYVLRMGGSTQQYDVIAPSKLHSKGSAAALFKRLCGPSKWDNQTLTKENF